MTNLFKYTVLILLLILLTCCSEKNELIVDEIYISKHSVGPPILATIRFTPPGSNPRTVEEKIYLSPEDSAEIHAEEICFRSIPISKSGYNPKLIIRVNRAGDLTGYIKNCIENKEGYFNLILSDSLIDYFNNQIEKMNYKKLDTLYSENDYSYYDGPEYFLSVKKSDYKKQIFIFDDHKVPRNIIRFIDSLYNYANTLKLSDTGTIPFRRDTLIVLKSENYLFNQNRWKNLIPIRSYWKSANKPIYP